MKGKRRFVFMLMILVLSASGTCFGQRGDVALIEGFYNAWLSDDWQVIGDNWAVWYISNTSFAGSKPHEMMMYPDYNFNGTTMLSSPKVDLDKYDYIMIQFNHCVETYDNPNPGIIGIGTSANGVHWESIWTDTITGNIDQCQYLLTFDMEQWSAKSNSFCLYYTGDGNCIKKWYIDNFIVFADKKDKYGRMGDEADDKGFVAAKSRLGNGRREKNMFSRMKRSKNKFSKIVNGNR